MWGLLLGLFYSLLFGAFLHLLYEGVRLLRVLCGLPSGGRTAAWLARLPIPYLPRGFATRRPPAAGQRVQWLLLFLTDLLFLPISAFLFSIFLYWQNEGQLRLVLLLAVLLGYFLFHITVGRLLLWGEETVAFFLRVLLAYLFLAVRVPIVFLVRWLLCLLRWFGRVCASFFLFLYVQLLLPFYSRSAMWHRLRCSRKFSAKI